MRGLIKRHGENIYQNGDLGKHLCMTVPVRKDDPRIALNGTLDEVTCALGIARARATPKVSN